MLSGGGWNMTWRWVELFMLKRAAECCKLFIFFKQKTAYEVRISDWSSDVCSSDLVQDQGPGYHRRRRLRHDARGADAALPARPEGRPRAQLQPVADRKSVV